MAELPAPDDVEQEMPIVPRRLAEDVERLLRGPTDCVLILGARQVGKTELARDIQKKDPTAVFLRMDRPGDRQVLNDAEAFFERNRRRLVILDEVQEAPELFGLLRSEIDIQRRLPPGAAGKFLLLGSSSLKLERQAAAALTGRHTNLLLQPLHLLELAEYISKEAMETPASLPGSGLTAVVRSASPDEREVVDRLWLRGGFPKSYFAPDEGESLIWRRSYIDAFFRNDLPLIESQSEPDLVRRFWRLLSAWQGRDFKLQKACRNLRTGEDKLLAVIALLERLHLIRKLEPWMSNPGKRQTASPRYLIRDSGLLHAEHNFADQSEAMANATLAGHSWEAFAIECLIGASIGARDHCFFREPGSTGQVDELDLVVEDSATSRWAIEIKLGRTPELSAGNRRAANKIGAQKRILVYRGPGKVSLADGFEAMPLIQACRTLSAAHAIGGTSF